MNMIKLICMMICATLLMASLASCNFITADDVDASGNLITEAENTAGLNENAVDMMTNYEVFEEENNNFFSYMTFSEDNVVLSGDPVTDGTNNYFYFKIIIFAIKIIFFYFPQQFLYFFPLPQGQRSFLPAVCSFFA